MYGGSLMRKEARRAQAVSPFARSLPHTSGRGRNLSIVLSISLLAQSVAPAWASQFQVFNRTYERTNGTPVTDTDTFSVLNPSAGWSLIITNGVNGNPLVTSATATINSASIITPNNLHQNQNPYSESVTLQASNTLVATMQGRPDGTLNIQVVGQDNAAPVLSWNSPTSGQVSQSAAISASLHLTDDVSG